MAPQDVAFAVAIEVCNTGNLPSRGNRNDRARADERLSVHLPHRELTTRVVPQDVALAVTAEIADTCDLPVSRYRTAAGVNKAS